MIILGIETSCDETSVAIMDGDKTVLSHMMASQIKHHQPYGGVVPEMASRLHTESLPFLLKEALKKAGVSKSQLDLIAVTRGPGLEGALLVGLTAAKTLGHILDIPVVGVNHLVGHIYASFLAEPKPEFPFVALIVSGGHTQLIQVDDHFKFKLLGQTRDDAAGEAFDKIARALNLPYPGGPEIEKRAKQGDPTHIRFPRAMINKGAQFSFSGLKTAVIQYIKSEGNSPINIPDICAGFQAAVSDILLSKTLYCCQKQTISQAIFTGGVSANQTIGAALKSGLEDYQIKLTIPPLSYATDNAVMIALAGFYYHQLGLGQELTVSPQLKLCNSTNP